MKIIKNINYVYQCEVCKAEYEREKDAERCEKLPAGKAIFKKGDKVEISQHDEYRPKELTNGKILKIRLYSPINAYQLAALLGLSCKSHFYIYDVKYPFGGISSHSASQLKLIKNK